MKPSLIVTCEHAGNDVPEEYLNLFSGAAEILESHRGWDPGAYSIAEFLSEHLQSSCYSFHITRLLIEMNRSLDSKQLYSEFSSKLSTSEKTKLVEEFYNGYRIPVEDEIASLSKPVVHLSIHSFTPVWEGKERTVDIGLLFDPQRKLESSVCVAWRNNLAVRLPDKNIRFNEPYLGTDDGFTTNLRTRFADEDYAGIEVEVNQKFVSTDEIMRIQSALVETFPF